MLTLVRLTWLSFSLGMLFIIMQECAAAVKADFGTIDILVHSLANGPEVWTRTTNWLKQSNFLHLGMFLFYFNFGYSC